MPEPNPEHTFIDRHDARRCVNILTRVLHDGTACNDENVRWARECLGNACKLWVDQLSERTTERKGDE